MLRLGNRKRGFQAFAPALLIKAGSGLGARKKARAAGVARDWRSDQKKPGQRGERHPFGQACSVAV